MYHERLSYLNYMQSLGMSFNRLREHAEMQLHIIDELGISEKNHTPTCLGQDNC